MRTSNTLTNQRFFHSCQVWNSFYVWIITKFDLICLLKIQNDRICTRSSNWKKCRVVVVVVVVVVHEFVEKFVVLFFDRNFKMFKSWKDSTTNFENDSKMFWNETKTNNKFVNSNTIFYIECDSFEKCELFEFKCVIVIVFFLTTTLFWSKTKMNLIFMIMTTTMRFNEIEF